jgi:hypothetical protein
MLYLLFILQKKRHKKSLGLSDYLPKANAFKFRMKVTVVLSNKIDKTTTSSSLIYVYDFICFLFRKTLGLAKYLNSALKSNTVVLFKKLDKTTNSSSLIIFVLSLTVHLHPTINIS